MILESHTSHDCSVASMVLARVVVRRGLDETVCTRASVLAEARGTTEGVVYEEAVASDMLCAARNQPAVAPYIFRLRLCLMGSLC